MFGDFLAAVKTIAFGQLLEKLGLLFIPTSGHTALVYFNSSANAAETVAKFSMTDTTGTFSHKRLFCKKNFLRSPVPASRKRCKSKKLIFNLTP